MKTLIQRTLVALSAVLLTAIGASAVDFEVNGIYYNIVSDGVEVTSGSRNYTGDITVPAKVTYNAVEYDVVGVGKHAFLRNTNLTSATFEGPITYIGYEAFKECYALASVCHGGNIRTIGDGAFYKTDLTEFDFNDGLIEIGYGAFSKTKLTSFTIPETLKRLGSYALANTRIQNNIDIPPSVEVIGDFAFANTRIARINVPATVRYLGFRFAANCGFLTEVVLDCEVDAEPLVGDRGAYLSYNYYDYYPLLSDCRGLSSVKIFGNIRNIQGGAFIRVAIRELYLGKNIEVISESAFLDSSIQNIYFLSENPPIIGKYFRWWAYDFPYMTLPFEPDERYVSLNNATLKTNFLSGTVNVHIPQGSLQAYRSSELSSLMSINFIEDLPSASIDEIVADNDTEITVAEGRIIADGVVEVYAADGRMVGRGLCDDLPALTPGLYIVRTPSAAKKIIVR